MNGKMTDLVSRARGLNPEYHGLAHELADRIEQLEAALKKIAQEADPRVTRDFFFGSIALRALEGKE